jgi:hypothetical protein
VTKLEEQIADADATKQAEKELAEAADRDREWRGKKSAEIGVRFVLEDEAAK